jgi:DNA-binding NarL/FixJ family response regulator
MADNNKYKIGFVDEAPEWISQFKRFANGNFDVESFALSENTTLDSLVNEIRGKNLDCVIVDFELKESELLQFNGDEIVDKIREKTPYFPLFIITNKDEMDVLNQVEDNDIVYDKDLLTSDKKETFILRIKNKIEHYYAKIEHANQEIERLVQLKTERALTPAEEEQLSEYYLFLEKIYPDEKVLPSNLTRPESISQLNDFVENTRKILEELKKQK